LWNRTSEEYGYRPLFKQDGPYLIKKRAKVTALK
jgi:hypothetical protein